MTTLLDVVGLLADRRHGPECEPWRSNPLASPSCACWKSRLPALLAQLQVESAHTALAAAAAAIQALHPDDAKSPVKFLKARAADRAALMKEQIAPPAGVTSKDHR